MPHDVETIRFRSHSSSQGIDLPAAVDLLDQTLLPDQLSRLICETPEQLHNAIVRLVVRGAPAIGIAAAYGVCLVPTNTEMTITEAKKQFIATIEFLATSRPTAVNLFWALDSMRSVIDAYQGSNPIELQTQLIARASEIHEDDRSRCHQIGRYGAELLKHYHRVMTHCNAGGLATSTWGTALAPIYQLHHDGHEIEVFADETRPLMQGSRLTAWELCQAGVPTTICTDSMAGSLMRQGRVQAVIVGADRIAGNGDIANKIGTYPLAVLAKHHQLPFFVAAPTNTFDLSLETGDQIPIEQRNIDEIAFPGGASGRRMAASEAEIINPAFDVTPAELVTAIITERGVIECPNASKVSDFFTTQPLAT